MKKSSSWIPMIAMMLFALSFAACKKASSTNGNDLTNSKDANGVSNAVDATSDDATATAGQYVAMAGKKSSGGGAAWYMLCGATVVDTTVGQTITVTYDSSTVCNGVIRSGKITITLATGTAHWMDRGAVLNVHINNVKVTDVTSGNSFTLNGDHTITNETGGLAWEMFWNPTTGDSVAHRDRSSNMTVTFSDGTSGNWNVDRTRVWSVPTSAHYVNFKVESENTGSEDSWGTNRYGESFNTQISTPIQADNASFACAWRPYAGKYVYNVPSRNATASVLFGTNNGGTPVGSPTACTATGYYFTYTLSTYGFNYNLYLPYW